MRHADERLLRRRRVRRGDARLLHAADEMAVAVDEPGDEREAAEVEVGRAVGRRQRAGRDDPGDAPVLDDERPAGEELAGDDVEDPSGADGEAIGHVDDDRPRAHAREPPGGIRPQGSAAAACSASAGSDVSMTMTMSSLVV